MDGKLLNEQHLISILKRRVTGSPVSIRVKMPHCWKSHVAAHILKTEVMTAIVEVQCYGSDERMLLSPKRSNELK